ncbi:MAG: DUF4124 domain-containing protein [Candidatus Schekmanbacteria bacterium]|nr:DUF4124 domain-containing protein [Candidatus Schekmanbacteria bacterium]
MRCVQHSSRMLLARRALPAIFLTACLATLGVRSMAAADVYRWVDETGKTHVSSSPREAASGDSDRRTVSTYGAQAKQVETAHASRDAESVKRRARVEAISEALGKLGAGGNSDTGAALATGLQVLESLPGGTAGQEALGGLDVQQISDVILQLLNDPEVVRLSKQMIDDGVTPAILMERYQQSGEDAVMELVPAELRQKVSTAVSKTVPGVE